VTHVKRRSRDPAGHGGPNGQGAAGGGESSGPSWPRCGMRPTRRDASMFGTSSSRNNASLITSLEIRGSSSSVASLHASVDFPLAGGPETRTYDADTGGEATRLHPGAVAVTGPDRTGPSPHADGPAHQGGWSPIRQGHGSRTLLLTERAEMMPSKARTRRIDTVLGAGRDSAVHARYRSSRTRRAIATPGDSAPGLRQHRLSPLWWWGFGVGDPPWGEPPA